MHLRRVFVRMERRQPNLSKLRCRRVWRIWPYGLRQVISRLAGWFVHIGPGIRTCIRRAFRTVIEHQHRRLTFARDPQLYRAVVMVRQRVVEPTSYFYVRLKCHPFIREVLEARGAIVGRASYARRPDGILPTKICWRTPYGFVQTIIRGGRWRAGIAHLGAATVVHLRIPKLLRVVLV